MTRALLTDREREVLAGEATDVDYPQKYESNTRTRVRQRIDKFEKDMQVLEAHEPEIAEEIHKIVCNGTDNHPMHDVLTDIQSDIDKILEHIEKEDLTS